jgi:fimbrial chaperone protein
VKLPIVLLAAAGALVLPVSPRAASMEIAPILVELGPKAPSAVVAVRNGGTTPTRYQVTAMAWTEPAAGQTKLVPSQELAAYPPLFTLAAGEERKIRVGATVPPGADERAWRLFVEELPSAVGPSGTGAQIQIRTRFAIPVFLAPIHPEPAGAVSLAVVGGLLETVVRNAGNVHLRPGAIAVTLFGAADEKLGTIEVAPAVVLALSERASRVDVPRELCARVRSAMLVADLPNEKLRASLALPDGACAP